MNKLVIKAALSATMLGLVALTPMDSQAASDGFYAGGFGSIAYTQDLHLNFLGERATISFKNPSAGGGGHIGYKSGPVRYEAELLYLRSPVEKERYVIPAFNAVQEITGYTDSFNAFGNIYYDFNTGTKFQPYVGAGIGAAYLAGHVKSKYVEDGYVSIEKAKSDTMSFAAQGIAGVTYNLSDNTDLFADYRLITQTDVILGKPLVNHSVNVGLNIKLG